MTKSRDGRGSTYARLHSIDLPRMQVEDRRRVVGAARPGHEPPAQRQREQPEIAAARRGHVHADDTKARERDFEQPRHRREGAPRQSGPTAAIASARINARAVAIARFGQDRMRPRGSPPDREAGRAIAADRNTAGVLEDAPGVDDVAAEGGRGLAVDAPVREAVARQLMPCRDNAPYQRRVPAGDPAEHEEGRAGFGLGKNLQQALGIGFDAPRKPVPLPPVNDRDKGLDLEIILDIDGHRMRDVAACDCRKPRRRVDHRQRVSDFLTPVCGAGGSTRSRAAQCRAAAATQVPEPRCCRRCCTVRLLLC
jgi:hypothetical protein